MYSFVKANGVLKISFIRDTNTYEFIDNNKIIVPTMKKCVKHILGIENYRNNKLFSVKFGNGIDLQNPISEFQFPTLGNIIDVDTALPLASTIEIIENENDISYTVIITITPKDANKNGSVVYSEIGLFLENGDMFAYKQFPSQTKDDSTKILVEWTFDFLLNS